MSNLIHNGDFQSPLLDSNGDNYLFYDTMTPLQASQFYWVGFSYILNTGTGYNEYPPPSAGLSSQYVNFLYSSSLFQTINVTKKGKYALTLYTCKRPAYNF